MFLLPSSPSTIFFLSPEKECYGHSTLTRSCSPCRSPMDPSGRSFRHHLQEPMGPGIRLYHRSVLDNYHHILYIMYIHSILYIIIFYSRKSVLVNKNDTIFYFQFNFLPGPMNTSMIICVTQLIHSITKSHSQKCRVCGNETSSHLYRHC